MKKQSKRVCVGEITSGYGIRKHPITRKPGSIHNGVDIACPEGTAIYSPVVAKVMSVYYHEKGGLTAILKEFDWSDTWTSIKGNIEQDSVSLHYNSLDTLVQEIHVEKHKFLFIRWGVKAIRQSVTLKNPNSRIVSTEYIKIH